MAPDEIQADQEDDDAHTICVVAIARRVCGAEAAQQLISRFGGTGLYIPQAIGPCHPIAEAVGVEAAQLISAECGGVKTYVPKSKRDSAERRRAVVHHLAAEGATKAAISHTTGFSERVIYRDLAILRERGLFIGSTQAKAQIS